MQRRRVLQAAAALALVATVSSAGPAMAAYPATDRLCDASHENCRTQILDLIAAETQLIDVAFWFMEDARYSAALIRRFQAGVRVRVLFDSQALSGHPVRQQIIDDLRNAGIPIRDKTSGGILHWKLMVFAGQGVANFSAANFSGAAYVPIDPYNDYNDEVVMFTTDPSLVGSFKTKYDDVWTSTSGYSNYANLSTLRREHPTVPIDPQLNFPPAQNYATRAVARYDAEGVGIDVDMYRITDRRHSDAMIRAVQRGVPVRLYTEPLQYRDASRLWHSWNVDRMYAAGIEVRHRQHAGLNHQKSVILHGQRMVIFGSSNWTSPSASSQLEHNLFTTSADTYSFFRDQFTRKWNNTVAAETTPFVPLPPEAPQPRLPLDGAVDQALSVTLKWYAGPWAHKYDVYVGTDPSALLKVVDDEELGPSQSSNDLRSATVSNLAGGTTYYWRVISRTMADLEKAGPVWTFRTAGAPPAGGSADVVLWASRATTGAGWAPVADSTAAGGYRLANSDAGAAKITMPAASPTNYFELSFDAAAGVPYRLWIRGRAEDDFWANDSVYAQFSDSVTASGAPIWRIGSTSATIVSIEDCSGCGLSNWGWNDNGWDGLGPLVYFANSGVHTVRVQVREDGLSIDQIVLSPSAFLNTAPGASRNDGTVYPEQGGSTDPSLPPPTGSSLPEGWETRDIGQVAAEGSAVHDGSSATFTLRGSGADIWGVADEFRFAYTTLVGDGTIVARVSTLQGSEPWSKAGVMFRSSLSADAAHAFVLVSSGKGIAFQRRDTTGGESAHIAGPSGVAPYWVKLTREGSFVSAYASSTGSTWTLIGSGTIAMGATVYAGLAVTSHADGTIATAEFSSVRIQQNTSAPPLPAGWSSQDIGAVGSPGHGTGTGTTFDISGSGADIWGTADAFHYAYRTLTGDGVMTARITHLDATDAWTKAGVMIRDSLTAGSPHGFMLVSAGKGAAFQRRTAAGGLSTHTAGPPVRAPYWVRLERLGGILTASASADGVSWVVVGSESISMGATVYVGLAVTSHQTGVVSTAAFDNVDVQ